MTPVRKRDADNVVQLGRVEDSEVSSIEKASNSTQQVECWDDGVQVGNYPVFAGCF